MAALFRTTTSRRVRDRRNDHQPLMRRLWRSAAKELSASLHSSGPCLACLCGTLTAAAPIAIGGSRMRLCLPGFLLTARARRDLPSPPVAGSSVWPITKLAHPFFSFLLSRLSSRRVDPPPGAAPAWWWPQVQPLEKGPLQDALEVEEEAHAPPPAQAQEDAPALQVKRPSQRGRKPLCVHRAIRRRELLAPSCSALRGGVAARDYEAGLAWRQETAGGSCVTPTARPSAWRRSAGGVSVCACAHTASTAYAVVG